MPRAPRRWTLEEDQILRREAASQLEEGSVKSWNRIADQLPGRSNKDCRKRWCNEVAGGLKKGPWSRDEDQILEEAVRKYGQRWTTIAPIVGTRSADQCAKRWTHSLDPALDRSVWTTEEDQLLFRAVKKHKRSWKEIQSLHYPGRSCNDIKNRYTILSRRADSIAMADFKTPCCDGYGGDTNSPEIQRPRSRTNGSSTPETQKSPSPFDNEELVEPRTIETLDSNGIVDTDISFEGYLQSSSFTPKSMCLPTPPPILGEEIDHLSHMQMEDVNLDQFLDFSDLYGGTSNLSSVSTGITTPWPSDSATDVTSFDDVNHTSAPLSTDGFSEMDLSNDQSNSNCLIARAHGFHEQDTDANRQSQVRLVIDSPIEETSRAIVNSILRAQAKVSMTAEADSKLTLILEDISTVKVNALLSILFESGTKFRMETY